MVDRFIAGRLCEFERESGAENFLTFTQMLLNFVGAHKLFHRWSRGLLNETFMSRHIMYNIIWSDHSEWLFKCPGFFYHHVVY